MSDRTSLKTKIAFILLIAPYVFLMLCFLIILSCFLTIPVTNDLFGILAFVGATLVFPILSLCFTVSSIVLQIIELCYKHEFKKKNIVMFVFSVLSVLFTCFYFWFILELGKGV